MGFVWVPTLGGNVAGSWKLLDIPLAPAMKMLIALRGRMVVLGVVVFGGGVWIVVRR